MMDDQLADLFDAMGEILEDRADAGSRMARDDRRLAILMRDVHGMLTRGELSAPLGALRQVAVRSVPDRDGA